jgi:hypothetical protein
MRRSTRFNRPGLTGSSRSAMLLGADGDGSTLSLDFTTGVLDPRLTFTRGTTATFINSQGLVQYANANIIRQSENCGSWSGAQNITPTADAAIAPNGTQTADQLNLLASSYRYQVTSTTYAVGQQYVGSIWMRTVSGTASVGFRIANSVTGTNSAIATCSVTETWQRFTTPAFTLSDSANRVIDIGIDQRSIVSGPNVAANIYVWGLQLQPGTSAGEYLPTTTTENLNVPRFDHDPSTQAPRGLLVEGQATNLINYSNDFANANWVVDNSGATNPSVSTVSQTGPDGASTVTRITLNKTGGTFSRIRNSAVGTASQPYTMSVWMKANTASGGAATQNVGLRIGGDPIGFNCVVTTTWKRFQYTYTLSGTDATAQILLWDNIAGNDETADVLVYGCQIEQGSGASSYIPTGASQATRNADSCVMTGTNFSSWFAGATEGVLYAECERPRKIMSPAVDHGIVGSQYQSGGWLAISVTATNQYPAAVIFPTGGFQFAGGIATQIPLVSKQAVRWFDANDITNFANGTQGTTNTAGTGTVTPAMLTIGANSTSGAQADLDWLNACVRRVKFWPVALPNSQIIALTTP